MKCDVAIVGAPFLDLTFAGLPRLPRVGEELAGSAFHMTPGGTGAQAVAAARLGLATALVAPIGSKGAAAFTRRLLEAEGVVLVGEAEDSDDVPVTAVLSTREGSAMASALRGREPTAAEVDGAGGRAVVLSLGRIHLAPRRAGVYLVTGTLEIDGVDPMGSAVPDSVRTLILNEGEGLALTQADDPRAAALDLARRFPTVVVTMGRHGAMEVRGTEVVAVGSPREMEIDATGAGDLFVAAYVWADLAGASAEGRIEWASLYAARSVGFPTAVGGALTRAQLLREGAGRGLVPPPSA